MDALKKVARKLTRTFQDREKLPSSSLVRNNDVNKSYRPPTTKQKSKFFCVLFSHFSFKCIPYVKWFFVASTNENAHKNKNDVFFVFVGIHR